MFKLIVPILSVVLASQAITDEQVSQKWKTFQQETGKSYRSPVEAARRLTIFKENLEKIEAHNALFDEGKVTFKKGVTKFTDLTSEEFLEYVGKLKMIPTKSGNLYVPKSNESIPDSFDWRDSTSIMPVKDQGSCGAGYAFSATGAIEIHETIKNGFISSYSEQILLDCSSAFGNDGCNGGNIEAAFKFAQDIGLDLEDRYPYEEAQGICRETVIYVQLSDYKFIADEDGIKNAVASLGPVAVGIDATAELQLYDHGVLTDSTCSDTPNHYVLVVGYGTENGNDYWLMRNSWGTSFGEHGYFKMIRNQAACAINSTPCYPVV